jgi:DNA-binding CsgD family transcriptional regulator
VTLEGRLVYVNAQAVAMFHDPKAGPDAVIGRSWSELFPGPWVEERLAVLRRITLTGAPVLMRTIWRGWQQLSWIYPMDATMAAGEEPDEDGDDPTPRFLVITRRVPGEGAAEDLSSRQFELVESGVADLGPLDALTTRELEVLALLGQGLSAKEVGRVLHRSEKTIETHRAAIGRKLRMDDRVKLAEVARRAGLVMADAERERV